MKNLYCRYVFRLALQPFVYVLGILFVICPALMFFDGQQFFSVLGTTDMHHFFSAVPYLCIVLLPAIVSMLPFTSRDYNLPYSDVQQVFARKLAVMSFLYVFLILTLIVPFSVNLFGDIDSAQLVCGYLGIALYMACACAMCDFFCILIAHQGAVFLVSAVILFCVNTAHLAAVYAKLPDFVCSVLKFISFSWHFDAAGKGIFDTRDVIFYLAVFGLFSFASVYIMQKRRGNEGHFFHRASWLMALAFAFVMADSSLLFARIDLTKDKRFTVSRQSRELLLMADSDISITYYRSNSLKQLYPQVRDVDDFLRSFASCSSGKKKLTYELIDPAKKDAESKLESYGIQGQQIQTAGSGTVSYTTVYSGIVIEYLGRTEIIPFVLNATTLEYDLYSRLQHLVRNVSRKCQVLVGNGLLLEEEYQYVVPWLESQGFAVVESFLPSTQRDSGDIFTLRPELPLIVIGTSFFTDEDVCALENFIDADGTVFIAMTPYDVDLTTDWSVLENNSLAINTVSFMLQKYGIYLKDTLTADESNFCLSLSAGRTDGLDAKSKVKQVNYPLWPVLQSQPNAPNGMTLFWPCAMDIASDVAKDSGFSICQVLVTSDKAWQSQKVGESFITNPFMVSSKPEENEESKKFALCVSLTKLGKTVPSVYVFGDQYALHSGMISFSSGSAGSPDTRSLEFVSDSLLCQTGQSDLVSLKNKNYVNTSLYKINAADFGNMAKKIIAFCVFFPVTVFMSAGILFFVRRKVWLFRS